MQGRIIDIVNDLKGGLRITLSVMGASVQELQSLMQLESLDIDIRKHRKKRSLDANAYLWILCTEIAEKEHTSKEEVYELMVQHYGPAYKDESGYIVIAVKKSVDMSKVDGHWKFIGDSRDYPDMAKYIMLKGSSEMDNIEMAHFLDCVVHEAKEYGIQTETPEQLREMKERWNV